MAEAVRALLVSMRVLSGLALAAGNGNMADVDIHYLTPQVVQGQLSLGLKN